MSQPLLVPHPRLICPLFQLYPLWLCPFVLPALPGLVHPNRDRDELYVDIGAYGTPKVTKYDPIDTTRRIEAYVRRQHG